MKSGLPKLHFKYPKNNYLILSFVLCFKYILINYTFIRVMSIANLNYQIHSVRTAWQMNKNIIK